MSLLDDGEKEEKWLILWPGGYHCCDRGCAIAVSPMERFHSRFRRIPKFRSQPRFRTFKLHDTTKLVLSAHLHLGEQAKKKPQISKKGRRASLKPFEVRFCPVLKLPEAKDE
jgi:hypothetical protein